MITYGNDYDDDGNIVTGVTGVTDLRAAEGDISTASGADLLNDVEVFLARFVVYPGESERIAHVLWIGHTWFMDRWESTPRIAFLSPEPGSGKSRALEVTDPLVPRAMHAINVTPSYLFRKVSDKDGAPTVLYDEIDTVFGPRAKDNEEIRGLLNAGHRKGAITGRCVVHGKTIETEEFPAYCAVALAGLDDLPDTLMSRSVIVRMQRRAPNEKIEPWRLRLERVNCETLFNRLLEWSNLNQHVINTWPKMPAGVEDRDADVWEALLAVADLAGGDWPERARQAAVTLVTGSKSNETSLGVTLLRDLRAIFAQSETDRLSTVEILHYLTELEESPWSALRGKPLDARGLSRRLAKYGVQRRTFRSGELTSKGYFSTDLADAWLRYLAPSPLPLSSSTSVTSVTESQESLNSVTDVTEVTEVSVTRGKEISQDTTRCTECSTPLSATRQYYNKTECEECEVTA